MAKLSNPCVMEQQIGLYPEKQDNDFIVNAAICYGLDIVIYVFSGISFVIAIILKVAYNRQNNQQQSNDQAHVITYNNAQIYNIQTPNREPFPQEINVHSEAKVIRPNSKENEN